MLVSKGNEFRRSVFFEEWSRLLDRLAVLPENLVITGDLNFHLDNSDDGDTKTILSSLDAHGLSQNVSGATHIRGHTLDVLITRERGSLLFSPPTIEDPALFDSKGNKACDHFAIRSELNLTKPERTRKAVSFRRYNKIIMSDLKHDLQSSLRNVDGSADEQTDAYNSDIRNVINKHAPLVTKEIILRPSSPWYTDELRAAKRERRKAERRWRRTKLTVHREMFLEVCQCSNELLLDVKKQYYRSKVEDYGNDPKRLFALTKHLMGDTNECQLPKSDSNTVLANQFCDFFHGKIDAIRDYLSNNRDPSATFSSDVRFSGKTLDVLVPVTEDEIRKIVITAASKSCELDPLPTCSFKECLDVLLPRVTSIVNKSLEDAEVPLNFKQAVVRPLLKKPSLDKEVFKNYRPVSNLSFVSKVLEKVVALRLDKHLEDNILHEPRQSAYRKGHSTETALLRVHHDIAAALDNNCHAVLVMLDLSAAFDVIDHRILMHRLEHTLGITGAALSWIQSYLSDRNMRVAIGDAMSDKKSIAIGVPQGSVLGPKLYCMFTKPIGEICRRHNMSYHCYADDTQVYIVIRPLDNWNNYRVRLEACLSDISKWMSSNMLKLNHDKTELVVFAPRKSARDLADIRLTFDGCVIKPVPVVKNLGAYFDAALSMDSHVCAVAKSCYFQIRNIGRIRHLIDEETCKTLIHALVTSRLDYANALLVGLPCSATNKLQRVQNTAARMVTRTKKHDHITPVLIDLHWLPVQFRIQFKVLVHTYKAVHRQGPVYLSELIIPYCPPRTLRSENGMLLNVPRTRTKLYGNRRFDFSASTLWNALPLDLRRAKSLDIFKQNLKTHLFKSAFNA